jgi:hypothetical protein
MFAVAAVVAFAIAFILHLAGNGTGRLVTDAVLAGFLLVACHLAWGVAWPWRRPQP